MLAIFTRSIWLFTVGRAAYYKVVSQHLAYVQHSEHDYLIFYLSQVYLMIVEVYAALVVVNGEAAVLRLAGGCIRCAGADMAQGYAYAGQQLGGAEGLCYVVVRAQIQCFNLVALAIPGRKHYYWHLGPLADILDDVQTVYIRQAKIQKNYVGTVGGYGGKSLAAGVYLHYAVIVCIEYGSKKVDNGLVVFHYQHYRKILHTATDLL